MTHRSNCSMDMVNLPRSGINPLSPALVGIFFYLTLQYCIFFFKLLDQQKNPRKTFYGKFVKFDWKGNFINLEFYFVLKILQCWDFIICFNILLLFIQLFKNIIHLITVSLYKYTVCSQYNQHYPLLLMCA